MVPQRTDDDLRAKVRRDLCDRSKWRVENYDDGGDEVEIFSGTEARQQAPRFADCKYGDFVEVDDLTEAERQATVFALKKLINGIRIRCRRASRCSSRQWQSSTQGSARRRA
jgi:hypothetical protein